MLKEKFDTQPIPSNCDEKAVSLVAEREYTMGRRLHKITLKIIVLCCVFCLGFILGGLRCYTPDNQTDDFLRFAHEYNLFVYDTEQKVDDYYKMSERLYLDKKGLPPESPEVSKMMALLRRERPLAEIGPFAVFANNDNDEISVREMALFTVPLVALKSHEKSIHLELSSSIEKDCLVPRFGVDLSYSEEYVYEWGIFFVRNEDGTPERTYYDLRGTGVFDIMVVCENDMEVTYRLNGLSWERVDEQPLTEEYKANRDSLLELNLLHRTRAVE